MEPGSSKGILGSEPSLFDKALTTLYTSFNPDVQNKIIMGLLGPVLMAREMSLYGDVKALNRGLEAGKEALKTGVVDVPRNEEGLVTGMPRLTPKATEAVLETASATPGLGDLMTLGKSALLGGMTAYHGTPHKFAPTKNNPLGEFDLSKIGTGEGAQAYGHGIYLAENPGVAGSYKTTFSSSADSPYTFQTEPINKVFAPDSLDYEIARNYGQSLSEGGKEKAEAWLKKEIARNSKRPEIVKELKEFPYDVISIAEPKASLYEVDLPDEHIEKMLDWDAPLSKQPKSFRKAMQRFEVNQPPTIGSLSDAEFDEMLRLKKEGKPLPWVKGLPSMKTAEQLNAGESAFFETGKDAYGYLSRKLGGDQKASEYLNSLGIPGIKYYDGGSRAAGEGTRNFVIFDPSIAKITGKK